MDSCERCGGDVPLKDRVLRRGVLYHLACYEALRLYEQETEMMENKLYEGEEAVAALKAEVKRRKGHVKPRSNGVEQDRFAIIASDLKQ